jgi:hypothetical protein
VKVITNIIIIIIITIIILEKEVYVDKCTIPADRDVTQKEA